MANRSPNALRSTFLFVTSNLELILSIIELIKGLVRAQILREVLRALHARSIWPQNLPNWLEIELILAQAQIKGTRGRLPVVGSQTKNGIRT